jgi:hypothetical protein
MGAAALIYPMFAMVVLTAVVLVLLFRRRVGAVKSGRVSAQYFRLYQGEVEPETSAKASRHFSNLFEAPTLFYAGCLAAILTGDTGPSIVVIAWLYVVARVAHAYVHLGGNRLRKRMRVYFASWFALLALWLHVVIHAAWHA